MENDKRKLQRAILLIALEIRRICDKYQIQYFLNDGTQLGAVRHSGFIPWDDDLDIGMTRQNYEKFIAICNDELDKDTFYLQMEDNEKLYPFAFCKIQLVGTKIIEDFSKNVEIQHGIFVDVFPYDNLPDNAFLRQFFLIKNFWLKNMLWVKCGFGEDWQKESFKYKVYKLASIFFSVEELKKKRKKLLSTYNTKKTEKVFLSDYPKEQLPVDWISNLKEYSFEGKKFLGISNYHDYLSFMYGDYMKLPPLEKRVEHSNYRIDFGKYEEIL